jgi:hypothetical protein
VQATIAPDLVMKSQRFCDPQDLIVLTVRFVQSHHFLQSNDIGAGFL